MRKVKRYLGDFEKALKNLEKGIEKSVDDLDIDGTIKRFELCYELSWKLMKSFLEYKGLFCKSPRDCFKLAFSNGLINKELIWMEMIEDRNLLVHTYTFEHSRTVFNNIKNKFFKELKFLEEKIKSEVN
jgi:nucleotidyltransferase substrate binding protein (TIGR01987 family)